MNLPFKLRNEYVETFSKHSPFSLQDDSGLGEATFYRTYSRSDNPLVEGQEAWKDVCRRVIEGQYTIELQHSLIEGGWNSTDMAHEAAASAFTDMFNLKWTPPGRGLSMMGTPFVHERGRVEALQNCAFISTGTIDKNFGEPFKWAMNNLMLGVGVGFDTRGAGKMSIHRPRPDLVQTIKIEDTREAWSESIETLINSYLVPGSPTIRFDYSAIRPYGRPILGFGGIASGPGPLQDLHETTRRVLSSDDFLNSRHIVDIMNLIGRAVIAGNVRRSAEIAIGSPDDTEFINLKDYGANPERSAWGWTSNNSVVTHRGSDYHSLSERTWDNGEPGYIWLDNTRSYGRLNGIEDDRDKNVSGFNPCVEQPLEDREMCTLVEVYLPNIENQTEFRRVLGHAYRYAKVVTLANDRITDKGSKEVMLRNRRIGISLTGIQQFKYKYGEDNLINWYKLGYAEVKGLDQIFSKQMKIPESVRLTSVKPSGTVSTMANVTPGIHHAVAGEYFIRRVRMAKNTKLPQMLDGMGYDVVDAIGDDNTVVVSFPVYMPNAHDARTITPDALLHDVALAQEHWADNSVSATIGFDKETTSPRDISDLLIKYESKLKAIAFLPRDDNGYEQMPYEAITRDEYVRMKPTQTFKVTEPIAGLHEVDEAFCTTDVCDLKFETEEVHG